MLTCHISATTGSNMFQQRCPEPIWQLVTVYVTGGFSGLVWTCPRLGGRYVYRRGGNCGGRADLYSRTAGFKMVFAIPVAVDEITICIAAKMALSTPICQTCLRSVKWRVYRARYFFCWMSQPKSLKYIHSWRAVLQCPRVCMSKESISLSVLIVSPTTFSIYI